MKIGISIKTVVKILNIEHEFSVLLLEVVNTLNRSRITVLQFCFRFERL